MNFKLTEDTLLLYAAKHYMNPQFSDIEDFNEDLKRFKYIKRLFNRYLENDSLAERLILNHLFFQELMVLVYLQEAKLNQL